MIHPLAVNAKHNSERLEIVDLAKKYKHLWAVKSISLTLRTGEIVGLLGPNGSGKTTTFHTIVGLLKANRGHIKLNGSDISKLPVHKRAQLGIGYLPQAASVFRKLTVEENIKAAIEIQPRLASKQKTDKIEKLIDELKLQGVRKQLAISLSGGERRRVEIARLLAIEPSFMLLDEPFAGIDPIAIGEVQKLTLQFKEQGIGLLITDHNVRETLKICDRAYIIYGGEVLCHGSPDEILKNKAARNIYLGSGFSTS